MSELSDASGEVWKKFENYLVSNNGKISTNYRKDKRLLKPDHKNNTYPRVTLTINKKLKRFLVSRLVYEIFKGEIKKGFHIAHLDGNTLNNHIDNLLQCSAKENNSHKKIHGTNNHGSNNSNAKLNEIKVKKIKDLLKTNLTQKQIAKKFNVNKSVISLIKNNKGWKHV